MATLVIKRSDYGKISRDYQIFLDEKKIGPIFNEQTKIFHLTPGQHLLIIKTGLWTSSKVSILLQDGQRKKIVVSGLKNGNRILLIAAGIFGFSLLSGYLFYDSLGGILATPALIMVLYSLTVGQKIHLKVTEQEQATAY